MKPSGVAKNALRTAFNPFEELESQVAKPLFQDMASEMGAFFDGGKHQTVLAQEDLARARQAKKLEEEGSADDEKSQTRAAEMIMAIKNTYKESDASENREQTAIKQEVDAMTAEVINLAKTAGIETKIHLEQKPKKLGILDIKRLTFILRLLRIKANESKSAKELVSQRTNAKPATGMLAWVSGKQMKIHEQGTMQLQG